MVKTILRPVIDVHSEINGLEELVKVAILFVKAINGIAERKRKMIQSAPLGLYPMLSSSSHITHSLSNWLKDSSMSEMGRQYYYRDGQQRGMPGFIF